MKLYRYNGDIYCDLIANDGIKHIIFDTDWMDDVDDVVALRILSWAVQTGKCVLDGIVLDAVNNTSVKSFSRMANYEGLGDVLIGADKQGTRSFSDPNKDFHSTIINNWSYGKYESTDSVDDCVTFYRRLLSSANSKVDIISVGFLNGLSRLIDSTADSFSNLSGIDLVRNKVGTLWVMGGRYDGESLAEFNFAHDQLAKNASSNVCMKWPTPIVFHGFEVGFNVFSGNTISTAIGQDDILYKVLQKYGVSETGRPSWDPMTTILGIHGDVSVAGYESVRGTNAVNASTGVNTFTTSQTGNHKYIVKRHTNDWYARELNQILEKHGW